MFTFTVFCLFVATLLLYLKRGLQKSRSYLDAAGIPYIEPEWLFGNMKDMIVHKKPTPIVYQELYEKFPSHKIVAFFEMHTPMLLIRDVELVKTILIKDFALFSNHDRNVIKEAEPLAYNLFTMKGDEWKTFRTKLSPTFTAAKIKLMFPLVKKSAENLKLAIENGSSNSDGVNALKLIQRFTIDVIASTAFGIEVNSLIDPDCEFLTNSKRVLTAKWQLFVRLFFPDISSKWVRVLGLQFVNDEASKYFIDLIKRAVQHRKENNVKRGDFLDLLIAMKKEIDLHKPESASTKSIDRREVTSNIEMTPEIMAAQCFLFLSGGFGTTSNAMSHLLFELGQHPDIQEKARTEILSVLENNHGDLTYEILSSMTYSDMVISESLRKNSPTGFLIRMNDEREYKLSELNFTIKPNTKIIIPIRGLHYDKSYYERPDQFYPEHFTQEAIAKRPNSAYLPFGGGPRGCLGGRFGRMQLLVGIVSILSNFSIEVAPKTKVPLQFMSGLSGSTLLPKGGIWLKFHPLKVDQ